MTSEAIVRNAPRAAIAGAILGIVGDLYHFTLNDRSDVLESAAYRGHGLLIIAGFLLLLYALVGFALAQGEALGLLGRAGFALAFVGTPFVIGDVWAEVVVVPGVVASQPALADADASGFHLFSLILVFGVFAAGWLLLAVATLRARMLSRAATIVLAVGAVIAFLPVAGAYIVLFLGGALLGRSLARAPG